MSLITDDPDRSPRDCATKRHHHHHSGGWRQRRLLIAAAAGGGAPIILWLTLRPSAPRFTLLAATATSSNASTGGGLVHLDAALMAHNPNARAAALYDSLRARASYAGFQLATAGPLPPFQQAQGDAVLSASLSSAAEASAEEAADGRSPALLRLRIEGRLRWEVAAWVSGERALAAECVAVAAPAQLRAVVVQGTEGAVTIQ
uniref:Late embryogenesis abundant protein LEA-2 subgroup domain-containing protein n=1 Tax=Aegilops tauschii TaxID=37682 RepID=M8CBC1_AEGTA